MYLILRRATCHVSTVAAGQCRRTLQGAAGHYTVMLCRLAAVIDVLLHSCGPVDWPLTELKYTYSKNFNNITRNSVLRRPVASCGVMRSLDRPRYITVLMWFVTVKWRLLIALKFLLHSRHLVNILGYLSLASLLTYPVT